MNPRTPTSHDRPPLDHCGDGAGDRLVGRGRPGDVHPGDLLHGPQPGQHDAPLVVFSYQHGGVDHLAQHAFSGQIGSRIVAPIALADDPDPPAAQIQLDFVGGFGLDLPGDDGSSSQSVHRRRSRIPRRRYRLRGFSLGFGFFNHGL